MKRAVCRQFNSLLQCSSAENYFYLIWESSKGPTVTQFWRLEILHSTKRLFTYCHREEGWNGLLGFKYRSVVLFCYFISIEFFFSPRKRQKGALTLDWQHAIMGNCIRSIIAKSILSVEVMTTIKYL